MGRKIKWTSVAVPTNGYYYICGVKREEVIVLYLEKNEKIVGGDQRSYSPINLPDPPPI